MSKTCFAALACMTTLAWADPPKEVMDIHREGDMKFAQSKLNPNVSSVIISGDPNAPRTSIPRRATSRC